MKKLYDFVSIVLCIIVMPVIPIGFMWAGVRFAFELGYSFAVHFEHYGEKKGWESKEENDEFSKKHNLSL